MYNLFYTLDQYYKFDKKLHSAIFKNAYTFTTTYTAGPMRPN